MFPIDEFKKDPDLKAVFIPMSNWNYFFFKFCK
jgi:hypothetical protein